MKFFRGVLIIVICIFMDCTLAREIALTFDDAPTPDSAIMTAAERTDRLIEALKTASVPDVLFFVKADYIDDQSRKRLTIYTHAGFHLANHSYSHRSADEISGDDYIADVYRAKLLLDEFDNLLPYHRFPYLHYGKTLEDVKRLQTLLANLGCRDGYITVDNFDWYINALLVKAVEQGQALDYAAASRFYVETLYQAIEFYDQLAVATLGRSPKHVLLLHENDAAALFVGDLIAFLRKEGWTIISPQEAYQDPIGAEFPAVDFQKQGRVAAMAYAKGVGVERLRHPSENTEYLDKLFEESGIAKAK